MQISAFKINLKTFRIGRFREVRTITARLALNIFLD
jgi:hypothetical protein